MSDPYTLAEFRASRSTVDLGVSFPEYGFERGMSGYRYKISADDQFGVWIKRDGANTFSVDCWGACYVGTLAHCETQLHRHALEECFS